MDGYRLVLSPSSTGTRLLLTHGRDELLKGTLPSPNQVRHERAAIALLEGLSLWFDTTLPVALCVDAREPSSCLGLTDGMGIGMTSVFFRVEVAERKVGRRRGLRIRGMGDFRDLRQLELWCFERDRDF